MRYSPNLNIIIKALNKISGRLARDFGEIENLQNNPNSAAKFANSCYERIKNDLAADLMKMHPDYNLEFADGQKIVNNPAFQYNYLIYPIDGMMNLSRALPHFSTVIALEYQKSGVKEIIACAVAAVASNQLFFAEKGNGAFFNNRRIRVSNRDRKDDILCVLGNQNLVADNFLKDQKLNLRLTGCLSLDMAQLAAGQYDLVLLNEQNQRDLAALSLILKEAGGLIEKKDDLILAGNGKILLKSFIN